MHEQQNITNKLSQIATKRSSHGNKNIKEKKRDTTSSSASSSSSKSPSSTPISSSSSSSLRRNRSKADFSDQEKFRTNPMNNPNASKKPYQFSMNEQVCGYGYPFSRPIPVAAPSSVVIDCRDVSNRDMPLHLAVKLDDTTATKMLMLAGTDLSLQVGWSALQEAICNREEVIARIIRHRGRV